MSNGKNLLPVAAAFAKIASVGCVAPDRRKKLFLHRYTITPIKTVDAMGDSITIYESAIRRIFKIAKKLGPALLFCFLLTGFAPCLKAADDVIDGGLSRTESKFKEEARYEATTESDNQKDNVSEVFSSKESLNHNSEILFFVFGWSLGMIVVSIACIANTRK